MTKRILVLDGNSSQCLPLIRSFKKAGHTVALVCPGVFSSGFFSRYPDKKLRWPKISDYPEKFYQQLLAHVKNEHYDFVLGLSDVSTAMLSSHKQELEEYVQPLVPEYETYSKAADKYLTMRLCMENDIPCPLTVDDDEIDSGFFKERITFPVVVKPKRGVGAVGFSIISSESELQKRIGNLREEHGELLVQEYIPNELQYTAEVFCDWKSDLKACVISEKTRFFPSTGGTSSCNITIENDDMVSIAESLLKKIGWVGPANIDFILDPRDKTPKVIEINPRIGATVKTAFVSGVDIADMLVSMSEKKPIKRAGGYEKEKVVRNIFLDLLWFLGTPKQKKKQVRPAFSSFFNSNTYYQEVSFDDPFPIIGFFFGYLIKYSKIERLKKKLKINTK